MKKKINLTTNVKIALGLTGAFLITLVMIPVLFVWGTSSEIDDKLLLTIDETHASSETAETDDFDVTVYRASTSEFETMEFERYIIGVVAAEMPALFELDALRAQAIAARTYALRILAHEDYILDTVMHQVFLDDDQLKERWGSHFDLHFATIEEAVTSTKGIVLTYQGELITPMFFAMSSGVTENSEDVFAGARPYLRSVISTGYENHANFSVSESFTLEELSAAFEDAGITTDTIEILSHSEGGNVSEIAIGTHLYTGRDVREILGLRSAAFSITSFEGGVTFTTYGHGHGVGMSQHGANALAREGYTYEEILQHFYQNVTLVEKNRINRE
ncbi:MAG: stage II sporulation protein D [Defluviitaleaceae bacterium]|nr:stage II sporulation protein D [Defluviitaleaceae bacterium]